MASSRHPMTMEKLSCDILSKIFVRLMAKQLAQMRSVCKPWNALLSESSFIKSHLHRSIHKNNGILMFLHHDFPYNRGSLTTRPSSSPDLELTNFIKLPNNTKPKNSFGPSVDVIGSVNGLVCFSYTSHPDYDVHIWNPSLSTVLTLPPLSFSSRDSHFGFGFGFGFDPINDDYKVVMITRLSPPPNPNLVLQAEVYSMRKGSWESISQRLPSHITRLHVKKKVCLHGHDGHLHWLCATDMERKKQTILSFDLGAETFTEIPLPDSIVYRSNVLGVLGEKLCVMSCVKLRDCEVWVMDEFGVAESWVKKHSFPELSAAIFPYGVTSRKEFLFRVDIFEDHFVLYNPDAAKAKAFCIMGEMGISEIVEYVDSLVWAAPAKSQISSSSISH